MRVLRIAWAAMAALVLSACATAPKPSPTPTPPPSVATSTPVAPTTPPPPATASKPEPDFWATMRSRFAMPGCDADPEIVRWAHRFTRRPKAFEARLRWALPTLTYIEASAQAHDVAAEFALLPWVESRYRAEWPQHRSSAGMWQIVPITARTLHLPIRPGYDARMDRVAATDAVMSMLHRYHQRWQDWRLVDMAYNAGEYRIRHAIDSGPAPAEPVIPRLRVSSITRHHLIQVLAMACVIREPDRFHVTLPKVTAETGLATVDLERPINLSTAARLAGLPERELHTLNAAYLKGRMPTDAPHRLLLPLTAADRFKAAYTTYLEHPEPDANAAEVIRPPRYTVARGDSLWSIAHRFRLSVHDLRRWNHLRSNTLHPGHVLRLSGPSRR